MALEYLNSIAQDVIIPKLEEQIYDFAALWEFLMSTPGVVEYDDSGVELKQPVIKSKDSQGGSYIRGQQLSMNLKDTRSHFTYDYKQNYQPIVLTGIDMAKAGGGKAAVIKLFTAESTQAMMDFVDKVAAQLYSDGTGNNGADITGLAAIVDDGTNVDNYAGISRATNTWAKAGYQGSVGALAVADLQAARRGTKSGNRHANAIVTTEVIRDSYEDLLTATYQQNQPVMQATGSTSEAKGLSMRMGAEDLYYGVMPFIADEYCTSGKLFMINTRFLKYKILRPNPVAGISIKPSEKSGISMYEFQRPTDQDGFTTFLFQYSEMTTSMPRAHFQLAGITT